MTSVQDSKERAPSIQLEGIGKTFGHSAQDRMQALVEVNLDVRAGQSLCLIGPSGCGKTTLLKVLNRLIEPDAGRVLLDQVETSSLDVIALRRGMGYVVQSGALLPHLTVAENIGILWRLERWEAQHAASRLAQLLEMVGLAEARLEDRFPHQLSGGQRQRVSVARALALDPPVLLMDEPFGALDPITRRELQDEFLGLAAGLSKTMLIVTHDLGEAFRLGDRVAILKAGRIAQVGTPSELKTSPANEFVEAFVKEQFDGSTH